MERINNMLKDELLKFLHEIVKINQKLVVSNPKTTVVSAVERLTRKGYIVKKTDDTDRRKQCIHLTALGEKANEEHENYENYILSY